MATTTKSATTLEIGEEGSAFQIPVALKKIKTTSDVSLDIATPDGHARKQVYADAATGEILPEDTEFKQGVFEEKPKDRAQWSGFKEISKDHLERIEEETQITSFVVEHFIPLRDVPFERVQDAYFVAPIQGMSTKPLTILAKALRRTKKAGIFKLVKAKRQYLAVIYEKDGGLLVNTLAFSADFAQVREATEALARDDVKVKREELELASELVEMLSTDASVLDAYEDDLIVAKADLVAKALAGETLPERRARKQPEPTATSALEDSLRQTLDRLPSGKAPVPA